MKFRKEQDQIHCFYRKMQGICSIKHMRVQIKCYRVNRMYMPLFYFTFHFASNVFSFCISCCWYLKSLQVSLLEYRKRQREARRSGSKTECSSPLSTLPPLTVEAFSVSLESSSEPAAPTAPCNTSTTVVKEPQTSEEADMPGERTEKEEGQWYA